jgi:hypothetical protein
LYSKSTITLAVRGRDHRGAVGADVVAVCGHVLREESLAGAVEEESPRRATRDGRLLLIEELLADRHLERLLHRHLLDQDEHGDVEGDGGAVRHGEGLGVEEATGPHLPRLVRVPAGGIGDGVSQLPVLALLPFQVGRDRLLLGVAGEHRQGDDGGDGRMLHDSIGSRGLPSRKPM